MNDVDWKNVDRSKIKFDKNQFANIDRAKFRNAFKANRNNNIANRAKDVSRDRRDMAGRPAKVSVDDIRKSKVDASRVRADRERAGNVQRRVDAPRRDGGARRRGKFHYVINGNMIAGSGLVAGPVRYGVTGVKTLVMNRNGSSTKRISARTPRRLPPPSARSIRAMTGRSSRTEKTDSVRIGGSIASKSGAVAIGKANGAVRRQHQPILFRRRPAHRAGECGQDCEPGTRCPGVNWHGAAPSW